MAEEPTLHNLDKRLTSHEDVCAERQTSILKRLTRIEGVMLATAAVLLMSRWDEIKSILTIAGKH